MREEILGGYLAERLSEEDRDAFEQHYFECSRCFNDLQVLRAVQGELQRGGSALRVRTRRPLLAWASAAALAAVVVLSVSVVVWKRPPRPSEEVGRVETQAHSRPHSRPRPPESPAPGGSEPTVAAEPSLAQLARVDPPRYEPQTLRGARDEATTRFQMGMERYQKADYRDAITNLRSAAQFDPAGPHIRFFLGVSHLLLGQDRAAVEWLQATIALGDSAYLEEAHFYVAKAFLRQQDLGAAETHLKRVVQLRESRSGDARQLLTQIERLRKQSN